MNMSEPLTFTYEEIDARDKIIADAAAQSARAAALKEAAEVARDEELLCENERNQRPKDSYHWSFWEHSRQCASSIASAILALNQKGEA